MAVWEYAGRLGGEHAVPPIRTCVTGAGGVAKGQPVVASAGTVIGKTGGIDTTVILGIAMHAASAGADVDVCFALPDVLFYAPVESGDTPALLGKYGISTTMEIDDDNVTQLMVQVMDVDGVRSGYRIVRCVQE